MNEAYFSRLTLKRNAASLAPLIGALVPEDAGEAMAIMHRLMWTVMPEAARAHQSDGESRFLWRAADRDKVYLLGPRPVDESPFFRIETKPYRPDFDIGHRLVFDLRVNATANRKVGIDPEGRAKRQRVDVAIDRLHAEEARGATTARAVRRDVAAKSAAEDWLTSRQEHDGYRLEKLNLVGYHVETLPRRRRRPACIGVFELEGLLVVQDPAAFLQRVLSGFGRAKAFGCGLMLLRRAP
jgi:CRISPR system Cascade subunit CasE